MSNYAVKIHESLGIHETKLICNVVHNHVATLCIKYDFFCKKLSRRGYSLRTSRCLTVWSLVASYNQLFLFLASADLFLFIYFVSLLVQRPMSKGHRANLTRGWNQSDNRAWWVESSMHMLAYYYHNRAWWVESYVHVLVYYYHTYTECQEMMLMPTPYVLQVADTFTKLNYR